MTSGLGEAFLAASHQPHLYPPSGPRQGTCLIYCPAPPIPHMKSVTSPVTSASLPGRWSPRASSPRLPGTLCHPPGILSRPLSSRPTPHPPPVYGCHHRHPATTRCPLPTHPLPSASHPLPLAQSISSRSHPRCYQEFTIQHQEPRSAVYSQKPSSRTATTMVTDRPVLFLTGDSPLSVHSACLL